MPKVRGVYRDAKGGWYSEAASHKDPLTGRWKQVTRRGFATAAEAGRARQQQAEEQLAAASYEQTEFVFTKPAGGPYHPQHLSRLLGRISGELDLPRLTAGVGVTAARELRCPGVAATTWRGSSHPDGAA